MTAFHASPLAHRDPDRAWVASRKGLVELRRRRAGWALSRTSFLGEPVTMLLPPRADGRMLAALNLGHFGVKLHASDDAGLTWREVAAPTYPEQPKDAPGPAWKLQLVWALEATGGAGNECGNECIWAGTIPGGLFRSTDFGTSWQLVESLWHREERLGWFGGGYDAPGIHSICPHPARPDELLLALSCGGAWITRDGGATWHQTAHGMRADFMPPEMATDPNIQDAHRIVRCPAQPEVLWCQHHGGIWRSTDEGASWHELQATPSSFGFVVAVHPQTADTAWFVPAIKDEKRVPVDGALAVTRTQDGGRSFEALREGLPQQGCYDLVYRHGLDVGADGRTLLMGSTTGNLWASDDGGERWTQVSAHLPPIAAVRIG
jgi:hypothetical protein